MRFVRSEMGERRDGDGEGKVQGEGSLWSARLVLYVGIVKGRV